MVKLTAGSRPVDSRSGSINVEMRPGQTTTAIKDISAHNSPVLSQQHIAASVHDKRRKGMGTEVYSTGAVRSFIISID